MPQYEEKYELNHAILRKFIIVLRPIKKIIHIDRIS